jgi:hypothetical protein
MVSYTAHRIKICFRSNQSLHIFTVCGEQQFFSLLSLPGEIIINLKPPVNMNEGKGIFWIAA